MSEEKRRFKAVIGDKAYTIVSDQVKLLAAQQDHSDQKA